MRDSAPAGQGKAFSGMCRQDLGLDHVIRLESLGFEVTLARIPTPDPARQAGQRNPGFGHR